jgi:addiction module HigA family antidote
LKLTTIDTHVYVDPSVPVRRPGDFLKTDYLLPRSLSIAALARCTGIKAQRIHGILTGTPIDARQAVRLAPVLGTSALYWMLLQAQYDLARAEAHGKPTLRGRPI